MHRYVKVTEIVAQMHVESALLERLDAEELIHLKRTSEGDLVISSEDADRVRVVRMLLDDLEVNLAGVEVILHMRDTMLAMQRQFSELLDTLAKEVRRRSPER
jgi:MerR family transcriptional regulator/heat shock protein HspR